MVNLIKSKYFIVISFITIFTCSVFFYLRNNENKIINKNYIYNKDNNSNINISESKDPIIFSDTLSSDWKLTTWGSEFRVSSFAYKSSGSIALDFHERWSGFDFRVSEFDTKKYNVLNMVISPGSLKINDLYVYFYTKDKPSLSSVQISDYISTNYEKNKWYEVSIPLSELKAENEIINGIIFESASIGSVQLDNIFLSQISLDHTLSRDLYSSSDLTNKKNNKEESLVLEIEAENKIVIKKNIEPKLADNIFLDSFLSGWYLEKPLNVNTLEKNSSEGMYALSFEFDEYWEEFSIINESGIVTKYYDGVWMDIKRIGGNDNIQIIVYNVNNKIIGKGRVGDFTEGRKLKEGVYMSSYIPFVNIMSSIEPIGKILVTSEKPVKLFIDNFKFTAEPLVKPFGSYYDVSSSLIFNNDILNGWHFDSWGINSSIINDNGPNVIKFNLTEAGGGLLLKNLIGVNTKIFKSIVFTIKYETIYENDLSLTLYNTDGVSLGSVWLSDYINYDVEEEYQLVKIKFTNMEKEGENNSDRFYNVRIGGVQFSSNEPTNDFYIGSLSFDF